MLYIAGISASSSVLSALLLLIMMTSSRLKELSFTNLLSIISPQLNSYCFELLFQWSVLFNEVSNPARERARKP